jgi:hypothetical protein
METIYSKDDILALKTPTESFLVKLEDNIYGIRFKAFKLRDCDTNEVFHQFTAEDIYELDYFADHELEYQFPNKILKSKTIGSSLTLVVGPQLVKNLDLIERHYIDNQLVGNYVFNFPVFLPNSENNIEFIYNVPMLNEDTQKRLDSGDDIEARSDTFILVDNKLVIHRRAKYVYIS